MKNNAFRSSAWNLSSDKAINPFVMKVEPNQKGHTFEKGMLYRVRSEKDVPVFSDSTFGPEKFMRLSRGTICIILNPHDDNGLCEVFSSTGVRGWVYKKELEPVEG